MGPPILRTLYNPYFAWNLNEGSGREKSLHELLLPDSCFLSCWFLSWILPLSKVQGGLTPSVPAWVGAQPSRRSATNPGPVGIKARQ